MRILLLSSFIFRSALFAKANYAELSSLALAYHQRGCFAAGISPRIPTGRLTLVASPILTRSTVRVDLWASNRKTVWMQNGLSVPRDRGSSSSTTGGSSNGQRRSG